jgi:hypothetical protein
MEHWSTGLRKWLIRAVITAWGLFSAVIVLPFLTAWAEKAGWFDNPPETAANMIAVILEFSALASKPWVAWTVGGALGVISGFAAGVWLDALLRRKEREPLVRQAEIDLNGLADEAEKISAAIYRLMGESQRKPPTLPRYTSVMKEDWEAGSDAWRDENQEITERLARQYLTEYAASAWRVIGIAEKYVEITRDHRWDLDRAHEPAERMAQFLAELSGRLRLVVAKDAG